MFEKMVEKFGSVYQEGNVIFREGDAGDEMYVIHEGQVKISIHTKNAEHVLAVLGPGDFFGEMSIFTSKFRSATAVVSKKSVLLRLKSESMEYILNSNSSFAAEMIQKLCNRIFKTNTQVEELISLSKETRLLKSIVMYWKKLGNKSGDNLIVHHKDFSEYTNHNLGFSYKNINQNLNLLQEQKIIKMRKDSEGEVYITFNSDLISFFDLV